MWSGNIPEIMARTFFLLLLLTPVLSSAHVSENHPESGGVMTDLGMGGLLYDNWPKVAGVKMDGTHPLYPPDGKKKGKSSWRCKECHGWDYLGKDGRYRSGSHFRTLRGDDGNRSPDDSADGEVIL